LNKTTQAWQHTTQWFYELPGEITL